MRRNMLGPAVSLLAAFGGMLLSVTPAAAHHSFDAEYDANRTATLTGIVTKVDWTNPHAYIHFTIEDKNGKEQEFAIELGPPYALVRGGWKRDTVKIGDKITVEKAALSKDGSNRAGATRDTSLLLPSGEKLVMR
ncbi:MAG: hypothetical protein LAP40_04980 [Acidobacteriia bacterium]|nr:hypothetical protein [Terriglobia bacterium]